MGRRVSEALESLMAAGGGPALGRADDVSSQAACSWRLGAAPPSQIAAGMERSLHEGDMGAAAAAAAGTAHAAPPRPGSQGPGSPSRPDCWGRDAPGVQGGEVGRLSRRSWGESREVGSRC